MPPKRPTSPENGTIRRKPKKTGTQRHPTDAIAVAIRDAAEKNTYVQQIVAGVMDNIVSNVARVLAERDPTFDPTRFKRMALDRRRIHE